MKHLFLIIFLIFSFLTNISAQKINTGKNKLDRSKNIVIEKKQTVTEVKKSQPKKIKRKAKVNKTRKIKSVIQDDDEDSDEEYDYSDYSPSDFYEQLGQGVFSTKEENSDEEDSYTFHVSEKNISFGSGNGMKTITIYNSDNWFVDTQPENWIHLEKMDDVTKLAIYVDANEKDNARYDVFTIKSGEQIEKIHIQQEAKVYR